MKECLIVYAALSQVKRVKSMLESGGDFFETLRSPHCIASGGCSYAIRCTAEQASPIRQISLDLGIIPSGFYREVATEGTISYLPMDLSINVETFHALP
jgi:hypothetical protein